MCNSDTARWKRCTGQGMRKGTELWALAQHVTLPDFHMFTNHEALWSFGFLWRFYYKHDWSNHWSLRIDSTTSLSYLTRSPVGFEVESSNHLIIGLFSKQPTSIFRLPKGFLKVSTFMKDTFMALITGNSRGFRSYEPGTSRQRPNE